MIQQVMIMSPCRAWKSPLLLLSPLYWAAGLSVCVLFHPFKSMACERDEKNNLIRCEVQSCATRGQVTENKAPFRLLEKLPKDMFVLILRFLNSKDHSEACKDDIETLNTVFFSTKKTEAAPLRRKSLRPLLKEKKLKLFFEPVYLLKSEELFNTVTQHLPRDSEGKVKENPFVQSLAITAGGIDPRWSSRFPNLRKLFLLSGPTTNSAAELLNGLESFHQLEVLSLLSFKMNRTLTPFISPFLKGIQTLHVSDIYYTSAAMTPATDTTYNWLFVALPNLENLKLEDFGRHQKTIDLRLIPKLKKLYLGARCSPIYTLDEKGEDKIASLPHLREAVVEELLFNCEESELDEAKKIKIESILKLFNQAPSLRTVFPQTGAFFRWKMHRNGQTLLLCFIHEKLLSPRHQLIPDNGMTSIVQILEPYLNKEWAQSLWSLILAANGNWEKAIQHALALQSQGNEEATPCLIQAMLTYARDVNPSSVSPHFQAFLQQGRKLYRHPFSIDQERDWQAKWIAYIALYSPAKALLDSQEEKGLTREEAEQFRVSLLDGDQNTPFSVQESRIQKRKDSLQDASQRVEQIASNQDPLQWTQSWTLALKRLLVRSGQSRISDKVPSLEEERLILLLIKNLKLSFANLDPALIDPSLLFSIFNFYFNKKDSKEAHFWLRQFIDHSKDYPIEKIKGDVFHPALLTTLEQDPVYSQRFTEWIEPLLTHHLRTQSITNLSNMPEDFLPSLQEHYQKRFKQEGMDQGDAEEKAEVEAETKAEIRIYRIEPKYEKPALSLEISPIPQNNAAPNINEVLNINAVSNINALPNINAIPDSQEGQDKPELKMSDSFAEEL